MLHDHAVGPVALHPFRHGLHGGLEMASPMTDHGTGDDRLLPLVLQVHLCHRHVELAPQPAHQRLDSAALLLEGCAGGEVQVKGGRGGHEISTLDSQLPTHGCGIPIKIAFMPDAETSYNAPLDYLYSFVDYSLKHS